MTEKALKKKKKEKESIRIFGMPKGVVLWPTSLTAIICGIIAIIVDDIDKTLSTIFLLVFTINLAILFFDFSRGAVVGLVGIVFGLGTIAVVNKENIPFERILDTLEQSIGGASGEFLLIYGLILLLMMLLGTLFNRTFNYYIVSRNELVSKTGILGDARRYGAPNLSITKTIPDIFESLIMFGAGNLLLVTPNRDAHFYIENVPHINRVEKRLRDLLSKLDVEVFQL
ncbi:MAG: hypothetical protein HeimC2_08210 [Candidatus Heimdallarchaeota archaeon LC_2]|nr:MAG: hypothetical protein HeimC2_08210 [Candidatus Heimdallarchaeota archaeon LC_2]